MRLKRPPRLLSAALGLAAVVAATRACAEVSVTVGPTPIPRGDAVGARDITISNGLFAIAFAVDSPPPWGVARGGIVDIAPLRDGKIGYDIASLVDFMPNNWSDWPTTYQHVSIGEKTEEVVIVRTVRDWGAVQLETTVRVRDRSSRIHIVTSMTNRGEACLENLLSGYVLWPDGGHLIGESIVSIEDDVHSPGGWTAAYDDGWLLGIHAPFSDRVMRNGRDRYRRHDLRPGETRTFEAWLQIEDTGSLAPLVRTEIEFGRLATGKIFGSVEARDGKAIARPAVIASKNGKPFVWTLGDRGLYELELPSGSYEVYATAKSHAASASRSVTVSPDRATRIDFTDVGLPGRLHVRVTEAKTEAPLDARLTVREGNKPLIGFFGKDTFFTRLQPVGETIEAMAPGRYLVEIAAGAGFTSKPGLVEFVVQSGQALELDVDIAKTADPRERGWYGADLHHHSDVLDGFTDPEHVLRSELAAGVDIAFLSDHDSVVNNAAMQTLSDARGLPFIPATELSPSWGHFNAFPLDDGKSPGIETGSATVQEIFAEARRMGADIIDVNHPYSSYGYFENLARGAAPGGFDPNFDLIEIESSRLEGYAQRNGKTLAHVWQMWNEGQRVYLVAGSDAHDVWSEESGSARTYVHVEGDLTVAKFIANLKAGCSFVSQGPLVYPDILFGSDVSLLAGGELALSYTIQAVSGLRAITLIEQGREAEARSYDGIDGLIPVEITVRPESDTWYSLIVEDMRGRFAYTNPVWINVMK